MIQRVRIQGFRSLKDATWEPGALNVVIGPNASGKSNLLRALGLLQQSAAGKLSASILAQGGIAPLLWDGQAQQLAWEIRTDPLGENRDLRKEALTYQLSLRQLGERSAYRIEHELLGNFHRQAIGQAAQPLKFLERDPGHAVTFDFHERALTAHEGSVPDDQTLLSLVAGPFGNPLVAAFRDQLEAWAIHHHLAVHHDAPLRQAAVARLVTRLDADGQNLVPMLHTLYTTQRQFKLDVDQAMRAAFGDDFEELTFPPAADQRVQLRVRWRSLRAPQSAADLSDGTLRFLLMLAILANPQPAPLVAIDEPETGLHPSMLPIVSEFAREAAERTQVIFTTHSPQFLDAFREGEPPVTTVARSVEGATTLSIVEGDELRRFLGEYSLGALFRSGELEGLA